LIRKLSIALIYPIRYNRFENADHLLSYASRAGASHRIFYVVVTGPMMVLLHSYKKQSQKSPAREIKIAERRMKEVLYES